MPREIKVCTEEAPYSEEQDAGNFRWHHPNAYEVGEQEDGWPGGDIVTYYCPVCGLRFKVELPQ